MTFLETQKDLLIAIALLLMPLTCYLAMRANRSKRIKTEKEDHRDG